MRNQKSSQAEISRGRFVDQSVTGIAAPLPVWLDARGKGTTCLCPLWPQRCNYRSRTYYTIIFPGWVGFRAVEAQLPFLILAEYR